MKLEKIKSEAKYISNEEYHGNKSYFSSSDLKLISHRSMKHWLSGKKKENKETPALKFGTLFHSYVLERGSFFKEYVVTPEFEPSDGKVYKNFKATNDYKNQLANFKEQHPNKILVEPEELELAMRMKESLKASKPYNMMFKEDGLYEASFFTDNFYGNKIKIRPDYCNLDDRVIVDLKTTANASPEAFQKDIIKYDYDLSAALYLDVLSHITGTQFDTFILCVCEKEEPYAFSWFELDFKFVDNGRRKYMRSMYKIDEYKNNKEAGYETQNEVGLMTLPPWGEV